jgi:hypothetical protein
MPPAPATTSGCLLALVYVTAAVAALFTMAWFWSEQAAKYHYFVDVQDPLPQGITSWDSVAVVGLPCVVAVLAALAFNWGDHRSRLAIGVALALAAITAIGGAIVWIQPPYITCETPTGVSDMFTIHSSVPCSTEQLRAADTVMNAINQEAAALVLIGLATAAITIVVWLLTRKPTAATPAEQGFLTWT